MEAPCSLLLHSTPLLEEKRNFSSQALIPNIGDAFLPDWPCAWTRLAAFNDQSMPFSLFCARQKYLVV
jgi:hypothetical protein